MLINDDTIQDLIDEAKKASEEAYCPYSKFPVGAALLTGKGETFVGCNVENASYGLAICAERNAIFNAVLKGEKTPGYYEGPEKGKDPIRIKYIVIYTPQGKPTPPCGACRQVIYEFGPEAIVILVGRNGPEKGRGINELLPFAFDHSNL